MLSGVNATYSGFFFISLKPWEERKTPEESYLGIKAHLQQALSRVPSGNSILISSASDPGRGHLRWRYFHSGRQIGGSIDFLAKKTQIFMAEAAANARSWRGSLPQPCSAFPRSG